MWFRFLALKPIVKSETRAIVAVVNHGVHHGVRRDSTGATADTATGWTDGTAVREAGWDGVATNAVPATNTTSTATHSSAETVGPRMRMMLMMILDGGGG